MKYFDRAWVEGSLSEEESEARRAAYAAHLALIRAALPTMLLDLSQSEVLHDALFESVALDDSSRRLVIEWLGGDQQLGYRALRLVYDGVELDGASLDVLRAAALNAESELLYDEVHLHGDGRFEHRLRLWPEYELTVLFTRFAFTSAARSNRDRRAGAPTYEHVTDRPA